MCFKNIFIPQTKNIFDSYVLLSSKTHPVVVQWLLMYEIIQSDIFNLCFWSKSHTEYSKVKIKVKDHFQNLG